MNGSHARRPRLSIGLPVYNAEDFLAESFDALLGQSYTDFELIVSSNASTDRTDEICLRYQAADPRIRFVRQPRNLGAAPHHDVVFRRARGELFKWASGDDLYARDLFERSVDLLDEHPEAILAHSWTAAVDEQGRVTQAMPYPLATDSSSAPERFRSMLFGGDDFPGAICADDFYGVIRADVLRRVKPHDSFHHADQTFMAELALNGPFVQHPDWLYFRRQHAGRLHETSPSVRSWCANLDPRRADRFRHPTARLVGEFVWGYAAAIQRAPLTAEDRRTCRRHLAQWVASRASRRLTGSARPAPAGPFALVDESIVSAHAVVAGQRQGE